MTTIFRKTPLNVASLFAALSAVIIYFITVDPGVSYWDCPEYVVCASRLEIGHPPGNPVWMLAMRMATMFLPIDLHARVINMMSGIFMALAVLFLCRVSYRFILFVAAGKNLLINRPEIRRPVEIMAAVCSAGASLCFAFCDSAWFSAVEAEVYAMSAFLTSLSLWLMCRWAEADSPARKSRWLILTAYVMGLSLGVHQLNLLAIPALALIFVFSRNPGVSATWRAWGALIISAGVICLILIGLMHGSLSMAARWELTAVNNLGMPLFSGVIVWALVALISVAFAARLIPYCQRFSASLITAWVLWITGITVFGNNVILGAALSLLISIILNFGIKLSPCSKGTLLWMLAFLFFGYSAYALILIRGAAAPPMNEAAPTDIFALQRYVARKQYGSKPLLYGATPYSKPIFEESFDSLGRPVYSRYVLNDLGPRIMISVADGKPFCRSGMMTHADSLMNEKALQNPGNSYVVADHDFERVTTPELNLWFPRITGNNPTLLDAYSDWAGMDTTTMLRLAVSETIDSLGNPAGLLQANGSRRMSQSWRPTYAQNLKMLATYQAGYMYFRYLLWNFLGRQNDVPATGEIDHGNFITGFPPADSAMIGNQSLPPAEDASGNPGRNVYFGLPLIFGIAGIVRLLSGGRRGRRMLAVTGIFFFMTGLAIVVYLNQTPGEPRERDYSFLGSFMGWSIWMAFGFYWPASKLWRLFREKWCGLSLGLLPCLVVPTILLAENFDDHDRSGRNETLDLALDILDTAPPGIIFTQGDNFTFPLWHAVEMGAASRQWQVIDVSYLTTPEYVVNIMKQGPEGVPFIALPSDVAFGRFAFTRLPQGTTGDTITLAAALRELYASETPTLCHRYVFLSENDSSVVDLTRFAPSGTIPFRQLMLLDIIAANNEQENPTDIHFLNSLPPAFYAPLDTLLRVAAFSRIYNPDTDSAYLETLHNRQKQYLLAKAKRLNPLPAYIDPVIATHRRRNRLAYIIMAKLYADKGDNASASSLLQAAHMRHPYNRIRPGFVRNAGTILDEGSTYAELLIDISEATGDTTLRSQAASLLNDMIKSHTQWKDYLKSLPSWRRNAVSSDTKRAILQIPTLDSLLLRTGNIDPLSPSHQ